MFKETPCHTEIGTLRNPSRKMIRQALISVTLM